MQQTNDRKEPASRKAVLNWLVYLAVRVTLCVLQAMPLELCYAIARMLGKLANALDKRHVAIAMDNLRHAFPGQYTEKQLRRIVRDVFVHFATMVVEIAHIPRRLGHTTWRKYIVARNQGPCVEKVLCGRSVIILTAHFGNFELAGYTMALFGFKPHSIVRSLDNPYLEKLLRSLRTRSGMEIIYKRGAFDVVSEVMGRGGMVGFLSDQDAGHRGVFVEFMGRPASSHKGVALLSLEHDAPIVIGFARRLGRGFRFEVWQEKVIEPRDYRHLPDPVWSITQDCAKAFEAAVRKDPVQYFWLHRRWKHQRQTTQQTQAA